MQAWDAVSGGGPAESVSSLSVFGLLAWSSSCLSLPQGWGLLAGLTVETAKASGGAEGKEVATQGFSAGVRRPAGLGAVTGTRGAQSYVARMWSWPDPATAESVLGSVAAVEGRKTAVFQCGGSGLPGQPHGGAIREAALRRHGSSVWTGLSTRVRNRSCHWRRHDLERDYISQ